MASQAKFWQARPLKSRSTKGLGGLEAKEEEPDAVKKGRRVNRDATKSQTPKPVRPDPEQQTDKETTTDDRSDETGREEEDMIE